MSDKPAHLQGDDEDMLAGLPRRLEVRVQARGPLLRLSLETAPRHDGAEDLAGLDPEAAEATRNGRDSESAVVDDMMVVFDCEDDREAAEKRGTSARGRGLAVASLEFGSDVSEITRHPVGVFRDTGSGIAVSWAPEAGQETRRSVWDYLWDEARVQRRPFDVELVRRCYSRSTAIAIDWLDD